MFDDGNRENIAYLTDIHDAALMPAGGATQGHIVAFGSDGRLADSNIGASDVATQTYVGTQVQSAADALWNALKDEYALASYASDAWVSGGKLYRQGDYCIYNGEGYRCKTQHYSGSTFGAGDWDKVLSAAGKTAIEGVLASYSDDGKVDLSSLAPPFDSGTSYTVGQLVIKDDALQICTVAGVGSAATFSSAATVEASIASRISALATSLANHVGDSNVHVSANDRTTWNGKQDAIADLDDIRAGAEDGAEALGRCYVDITDDGHGETVVSAVDPQGGDPIDLATQDRLDGHVDNSNVHVSANDRTAWNGKQDVIADLDAIRSNAAAGADALERDYIEISDDGNGVTSVTAVSAQDGDTIELAKQDDIPTKVSDLDNDSRFITSSDIPDDLGDFGNDAGYILQDVVDEEFDEDSRYVTGDTCTRGGRLYRCVTQRSNGVVEAGTGWYRGDWEEITVKDAVPSWAPHIKPDWDAEPGASDEILNKPDVPIIDDTLRNEGEAADAKAVGDRIADIVGSIIPSYPIRVVVSTISEGVRSFALYDRTVNIVRATINDGSTLALILPGSPTEPAGTDLSRDFYIMFDITSDNETEIDVALSGGGALDYYGNGIYMKAPANKMATCHFVETSDSVFTITGFVDPAYQAVRDIERALDDILRTYGVGTFSPGMFVYDPVTGKYYKVTAFTDEDGTNLNVDQQGVIR